VFGVGGVRGGGCVVAVCCVSVGVVVGVWEYVGVWRGVGYGVCRAGWQGVFRLVEKGQSRKGTGGHRTQT